MSSAKTDSDLKEFDPKNLKPEQVLWAPQPGKQAALVACPYPVIFYGGARGGGKTDGGLGKFAVCALTYPKDNQLILREDLVQSDDLIDRALELYTPLGAEYRVQQKQFAWPNGSKTRFRSLRTRADAAKYQGQNVSRIWIEEVGNYPDLDIIWLLFGVLRSSRGIPTQMLLTGNPGGPGHAKLKKLFVDPGKNGMKGLDIKITRGRTARGIFIPAKLEDNPILMKKDPGYADNLELVGSEALVRAWRHGDWDAVDGAYFSFTEKNFCESFDVPSHWHRYIGQDWGYKSPFAAVWFAVSSGYDDKGEEHKMKKGTKIIYRFIQKIGTENTLQAETVYELSKNETIKTAVLDTACWSTLGQKSIAVQMNERLEELNSGWYYQQAQKDRIAGWSYIGDLLKRGELVFQRHLKVLIDSITSLPADKNNLEEVDTRADDHLADALRYGLMQHLSDTLYEAEDPGIYKSYGINLQKWIERHKESKESRI